MKSVKDSIVNDHGSKRTDQDFLDAEDGWSILLKDISIDDLATEWREQNEETCAKNENAVPNRMSLPSTNVVELIKPTEPPASEAPSSNYKQNHLLFYSRAFSIDACGKMEKPAVKICNLNHLNGREFGLISYKSLSKGSILFTERALDSVQIPATKAMAGIPVREESDSKKEKESNFIFNVKGCQCCFRSLASAKRLEVDFECTNPCRSNGKKLPLHELWPVQDSSIMMVDPRDVTTDDKREGTLSGRQETLVECARCGTSFCSKTCFKRFKEEIGNCCKQLAAILITCHQADITNLVGVDDGKVDQKLNLSQLCPPSEELILAVRLFCACAHRRQKAPDILSELETILEGMCGNACDVNSLELGTQRENNDGNIRYSLEPLHSALCSALRITPEGQRILSVNFLEQLAAIASRNCFSFATMSPFSVYYQNVLRKCGRNSSRHKEVMHEMAKFLGSPDGSLDRSMDRAISEKCVVETASLFALTSKMNHSCDPNCEVRQGNFLDNVTDVVALRDIEEGEELTVSYLNTSLLVGNSFSRRQLRQRVLRARYLFSCTCWRCRNA